MSRRTAVCAAAALAILAPVALASDPSSGKVSKATPKVEWSGAVTSFQSWQLYNQGQNQCLAPSCDTFTLEVADGPATLTIVVSSADSVSYVEVVKPDGSSELFGSAETVKATIKNAANGTYTIHVAQNEQTTAAHKGSAELTFPSAAPAPAPSAAPAPAAAPAPSPTLTITTKKAKRGKSIKVGLNTNGTLTGVTATLLKGSKTVARGTLRQLGGASPVTLKAKKALKKGRYVVRVSGTDEQGRAVTASGKLTLR